MAIFETGIIINGNILVEKKYYDSANALDHQMRAGLLAAVDGFAKEAFNTELDSFTLSSYTLVALSEQISVPTTEYNKTPEQKKYTLLMFAIIEKDTNEKAVKNCMRQTLEQFKNRYSINDIITKEPKYFKKFAKRFDKVFKDLTLKSEDRFGSMF
ncbi:MAG: hypothetical protein ACTSWY_14950 [Promethearchaeota archaeon]